MGEMDGPAYIRFGRSPVPKWTTEDHPFEIGKAQVLTEGEDVAIVACGALVWESLKAADELATNAATGQLDLTGLLGGQKIAIDADVAELVDDDRELAALGRARPKQPIEQRGLAAAQKPGE